MSDILYFVKKLIFLSKRPCVIVVTGKGRTCAAEALLQALGPHVPARKVTDKSLPFVNGSKEVLIFETDLAEPADTKQASFLLARSALPILAVTRVGDILADKDFFAGAREDTQQIRAVAEKLPARGFCLLNFDDETIREIKDSTSASCMTYGFQKGADIQASDVHIHLEGTNFKINHDGDVVPFWLKKVFGKEQIYSALIAVTAGIVRNLNLVVLSQALQWYGSLPGRMRLIDGIKHSFILDDSENATLFSMVEALDILRKIPSGGRKIAVLGDVLTVGKYAIEAHEAVGEKVAKASAVLFAFGPRARFIAKGARTKGMPEENIFQFDRVQEGKTKLQDEIQEGDLILVDGSKEMNMQEIIQEIKV